jgi:hypothetical protein
VLNSTSNKEAKEQSDLTINIPQNQSVSLRISATFSLNKDAERHIREKRFRIRLNPCF